jgi:hypothetical protein
MTTTEDGAPQVGAFFSQQHSGRVSTMKRLLLGTTALGLFLGQFNTIYPDQPQG